MLKTINYDITSCIRMFLFSLSFSGLCTSLPAIADNSQQNNIMTKSAWDSDFQLTTISQYHPAFPAAYNGEHSLRSQSEMAETVVAGLGLSYQFNQNSHFILTSEMDQGWGISKTVGLAGYSNGLAYKIGSNNPYLLLTRAYFTQSIDLTDHPNDGECHLDCLSNVTYTLGKFSVTDVFDNNRYAHNTMTDFLNWSIIDAGAFDYAADAYGYSYGASFEYTQNRWTLRAGLFDLSKIPNTDQLDPHFEQYELLSELEERHLLNQCEGKIKLLAFSNYGQMGSYSDALHLSMTTGLLPNTALVRRSNRRNGVVLNIEQELSDSLGTFGRLSMNDGGQEAFEFTDINQSIAIGTQIKGNLWSRNQDVVGLAGVINKLSKQAQEYFKAGGLGVLIGDGRLNYASERILEGYYRFQLNPRWNLTLDYQYITNPAYNIDRGPVSIIGLRTRFVY